MTPLRSDGWGGNQIKFTGRDSRQKNESLLALERAIHEIKGYVTQLKITPTAQFLRKIYKHFVKSGEELTNENAKKVILSLAESTNVAPITVQELLLRHIQRKRDVEKVAQTTLKTYGTRKNNIIQFLANEGTPYLLANDLTESHLMRFSDFMLEKCAPTHWNCNLLLEEFINQNIFQLYWESSIPQPSWAPFFKSQRVKNPLRFEKRGLARCCSR